MNMTSDTENITVTEPIPESPVSHQSCQPGPAQLHGRCRARPPPPPPSSLDLGHWLLRRTAGSPDQPSPAQVPAVPPPPAIFDACSPTPPPLCRPPMAPSALRWRRPPPPPPASAQLPAPPPVRRWWQPCCWCEAADLGVRCRSPRALGSSVQAAVVVTAVRAACDPACLPGTRHQGSAVPEEAPGASHPQTAIKCRGARSGWVRWGGACKCVVARWQDGRAGALVHLAPPPRAAACSGCCACAELNLQCARLLAGSRLTSRQCWWLVLLAAG
jgi:hypothetical protein